jgi:molecular chaperone GrpE
MNEKKERSEKVTGAAADGVNDRVYEIEEAASYEEAAAAAGRRETQAAGGGKPASPEVVSEKTPGAKPDHSHRHARKGAAAEVERLQEELSRISEEASALRSEATDLKDKWLRSIAEFDNFRKRTRREWDLLQDRTKADVVLNILSVADDFERAFSVVGDRDDDFIRGIRLIYNKFAATLEEVGVRKIEALGTAFDPTYHMAVAQIEREGAESNTVVEVVEEGYSLGDIVVRPAKVVIAK